MWHLHYIHLPWCLLWSYWCKIDQFWRSLSLKFPVKSADFPTNLPLKIPWNLPFFSKNHAKSADSPQILTFSLWKSCEILLFFCEISEALHWETERGLIRFHSDLPSANNFGCEVNDPGNSIMEIIHAMENKINAHR